MSPTVLRRTDGDVTRKYWWVILLCVLAVGGGSLVMMPKTGGSGPGTDPAAGTASEQSLESIDDGLKTVGAPGGPLNLSMDGTGAYRRKDAEASATMKSSLYEPRASALTTGTPVVATAGTAAEGGSLADALKKIASSKPSKEDNKGWGAAAVRTGFTPPKASFSGGLSGLSGGGGGGGGSGASMGVGGGGSTAFGLGGSNPGSASTIGGAAGLGGGLPKVRKGGHNQAMDILKKVETLASGSAGAGGDLANNLNSRAFDANTAKSALGGTGSALGGASVGSGVAENLKLDDPKLNSKKIEVPVVGNDKPADPQGDMEKQIMMMVITMAIGGIMGPMFGAMGTGMANMMFGTNMTFNPNANNNYNNNNVGANFHKSG